MYNNKLLKQTNVGTWWGAFRNLGGYISFYLYLGNTFILLINTLILGNMAVYGLPIPMWLVILLAVLVILILLTIAMVLEHKYTLPSYMTYWNYQFYHHGNLIVARMDKREPEIDKRDKYLLDMVESMGKEIKELKIIVERNNKIDNGRPCEAPPRAPEFVAGIKADQNLG
jgi:hypothetical protein